VNLRELHQSGCFVIPNPWDVGSAIYLHQLGFKALATTSAGFAFSRGVTDDVDSLPRDLMLQHVREIVQATPLPVSADFQNGYGHTPEDVAANVRLCAKTGAEGLSIEDNSGHGLYDRTLAIERVKAARSAAPGLLLTARCEAALVGHPEPLKTALDRLAAFADAGADCLFAPGIKDAAGVAALVKAVAPKPVNVLMSSPGLNVRQLSDLGVRRISVGSALARTAWGAFMRAAKAIATAGTFDAFSDAASFAELDGIFRKR